MIRKSSLMIVLSFFLGIFVINLVGTDYLRTYGIIPFWNQTALQLSAISSDRYGGYILIQRVKMLVWLGLLGKIFPKRILAFSCFAVAAFLAGMFVTMAVIDRGIFGMVLVLAAALPQWGCYLSALYLYGRGEVVLPYVRYQRHAFGSGVVQIGFLILAGCLAEGYLSPVILGRLLLK